MYINTAWTVGDLSFSMKSNFSFKTMKQALDEELTKRVFAFCKTYITKEIKNRFTKEVSPDGVKWKKLSPLTVAYKKSNKILHFTGRLRRSFVISTVGSVLQIACTAFYGIFHQKGVKIRTTLRQDLWMWYNLFKQEGSPYPKSQRFINIPKREFMGFSKANKEEIKKAIVREAKKVERIGTYVL